MDQQSFSNFFMENDNPLVSKYHRDKDVFISVACMHEYA